MNLAKGKLMDSHVRNRTEKIYVSLKWTAEARLDKA